MTARSGEAYDLRGAKGTLLYTLYGRALDNRAAHPILGDRWAGEVIEKLGGVTWRMRMGATDRYVIAIRADRLDGWTRRFLDAHPDANVLGLGCGLDSRVFRIDPAPTVRWYDVDYPEVVELRRRVYPERAGYRMIGSSVTDLDWLDEVSADRPTLVVAEGLFMYLPKDDARRLVATVAERFPSGELAFDVMVPWSARFSRLFGLHVWGTNDPHEIEGWGRGVRLLEDAPSIAEYARIPVRRYRGNYRLLNAFTATRNIIRPLRYRFGD
ncbi:MAG TPA: class I SAM-dependent methyltransferase [Streptosporangiales bacterium]